MGSPGSSASWCSLGRGRQHPLGHRPSASNRSSPAGAPRAASPHPLHCPQGHTPGLGRAPMLNQGVARRGPRQGMPPACPTPPGPGSTHAAVTCLTHKEGPQRTPPPQGGSSAQARLGRGIPKPQTSSQRSLGGGLLGSVPFPMRPRGPHFESTFHTELPTTLSISPNPDATSSCPAWASSSNLPPAPCLLPARNQDPWPFCLHSRLLRACYPALPSPLTTLCPKQV